MDKEEFYPREEDVETAESNLEKTRQDIARFDQKVQRKKGAEQFSELDEEGEEIIRKIDRRSHLNELFKHSASFREGEPKPAPICASAGLETKFFKRLFGDSPRVLHFLDRISEMSKARYPQFSFATYYDEEEHCLKYVIDHPEIRQNIGHKAKGLGISFASLYDQVIDHLGKCAAQIDPKTPIGAAVAEIIDQYNQRRGKEIFGEISKKAARSKWRLHPGILFGDYSHKPPAPRYKDAPDDLKYFGLVPTSRHFLEVLIPDDARLINSLAEPRMMFALAYEENQKDLLALAYKIDAERKVLGQPSEISDNLKELFANLRPPLSR